MWTTSRRDQMRELPRHAHRARAQQPLPRPQRGGEPRPVRAHEKRRVPGRLAHAARQDRHGSPNLNLRDPALYRILHIPHHQTGDEWCIYPMYDFAHPIQDALEGVTHSLCSLEFEAHRPLYDWVVEQCGFARRPRQIEFARLNLTNTVMSKRYLRRSWRRGMSAAGTTRACPRCAACAGAATPPPPCATSSSASACPRRIRSWTRPCSSTACARTSTPRAAPHGRARPAARDRRQLRVGADRARRHREQPERPGRGQPRGALFAASCSSSGRTLPWTRRKISSA